jgi:metal-sulfur cluster biosynthetic enzyme
MDLTGDQILRRVAAALTQVTDPRSGDDVISTGRVRELQATDDGVVRFRFLLQPDDAGSLVRDVRAAAERVDGVSKVRIDVGLPAAATRRRIWSPVKSMSIYVRSKSRAARELR